MKRILFIFFAIAALVSCGGKNGGETPVDVPTDVKGDWELTSVQQAKSAVIGSETVSVYLRFTEKEFEIYQIIGSGNPRKYSGTYTLSGNTLSGKYSDKNNTPWASSYDVKVDGGTLTMVPSGKSETNVYKKTSIPASVIEKAF